MAGLKDCRLSKVSFWVYVKIALSVLSLPIYGMRAENLTSQDPHAVCNDGSPARYYIAEGFGQNRTRWVIRFMGGGWCITLKDCKQRWKNQPFLMSTKNLPDFISNSTKFQKIPETMFPLHGILSPDSTENPYFASWNRVYLWYCSSDSHLGNIAAGDHPETGSWHFFGKRITSALAGHLLESKGLEAANEVLITGDSAGGVGAMNNADFFHSLIRDKLPELSKYHLLVDAGWFMDIPSFSKTGWFTFRQAAQNLKSFWNASYDESCEQAFGSTESWKCFHAQYAHQHIRTPAFFLEYLYDSANLGFDCATPRDFEVFRSKLVASFSSFQSFQIWSWWGWMWKQRTKGINIFAPACHLHESVDQAGFWKLKFGKTQLAPKLLDWLERDHSVFEVDSFKSVRHSKECIEVNS